jgi:hypothetical protein
MAESFEEAEFGCSRRQLVAFRHGVDPSDSNLRPLSESEKYIKQLQSIGLRYAVVFDHFTMRSI